ncbi:MAG: dockerin type I domain-containing protein [Phycisphaerae bacterium]
MNEYPDDIVAIQLHIWDDYETNWTIRRASFYNVDGTPTTWFDGVLECVGAYQNDSQQYYWYRSQMMNRLNVPTDVTIELSVAEVGEQTFEVSTTVGVEEGGGARTMAVKVLQVLDYFPSSGDNRYRNCVRQDAPLRTVTLNGGESTTFTWQVTLSGPDWNNRENAKIVAFARQPGSSGPREVYQAAQTVLVPPVEGDINGDGVVDLVDLALLLMAYGSCEGDPDYNANADFDGSGCVDLSDLATLLGNYGYGT